MFGEVASAWDAINELAMMEVIESTGLQLAIVMISYVLGACERTDKLIDSYQEYFGSYDPPLAVLAAN